MSSIFLDFLFPRACLECKKLGSYMCNSCLAKVPFANTICPACQRFNFRGTTHNNCRTEFGLDGVANLWMYRGVLRVSLIKLKYNFAFDIAKELGKLSEIELRKFRFPENTVLIPVPLYKTRNNWRGFNHAEIICDEIAKINKWKVIPDLLIKKEDSHPQVHLSRFARHTNLKGKFALNHSASALCSMNSVLILFDDVWTTGSTIKECCKVLKKEGYKNVWAVTIARS